MRAASAGLLLVSVLLCAVPARAALVVSIADVPDRDAGFCRSERGEWLIRLPRR